ncbi:hypothetical protein DSO57_1024816 [Entomophthora muscae]|uniref:Uncharacterized protein n=1 Tax=Entomophthora muscae TaxID=34485 RepID=A0ACC2SRT8_9FUNG|nr:hypothetical protein DSO57_1024816 [Entomophthora muscae]
MISYFEALKGILFLFWFLASFLPVVLALENPTPTTDWHNSSPNNAHKKESLAHGWFKYPSGHWRRKFHYICSFTPPLAEPLLVRPYASFYLLTYVVGYYMLGYFSSMLGRFAYLGHLGHLAMIMVPIGSVIAGLNLGALAHQIGNLFPVKWVPDIHRDRYQGRLLLMNSRDCNNRKKLWDIASETMNKMPACEKQVVSFSREVVQQVKKLNRSFHQLVGIERNERPEL